MQSKLVFVSINFEITILSTLTSENVIGFLSQKTFLLLFLLSKSQHYYTMNKICSYILAN